MAIAALAALAALAAAVLAGCGGGDDGPDARDFAGSWDVQLVVGAVLIDPAASTTIAVGDTFREHWVFEACDEQTCVLRRPDGGLALGDLDGLAFEFVDSGSVDDTPRFTGQGPATAVPRVDPEPPPGDEDEHEPPAGDDDACADSTAHRWEVTIEVDAGDGVLSGTVLRIPEALAANVGDTQCFGVDLTLGLSGIPADG